MRKRLINRISRISFSIIIALTTLLASAQGIEGDVDHGKSLFNANCAACHKLDKKSIGPALGDITEKRAKEKAFPFAYLVDEGQKIYPQYGAVRTPHVFLLDKDRKVQYIGSIDDNAKSEKDVKEKFVENAINALENGEKPSPSITKAIGCPVKAGK